MYGAILQGMITRDVEGLVQARLAQFLVYPGTESYPDVDGVEVMPLLVAIQAVKDLTI